MSVTNAITKAALVHHGWLRIHSYQCTMGETSLRKSKALCDGKRLKFCHPQLVHSLSWNTVTNHEMLKNLFEIK